MKYRKKPIVVTAHRQPDGTFFVHWPWGDRIMSEADFKREHDEVADDELVGCSCTYAQLRRHVDSARHAPSCPLSDF